MAIGIGAILLSILIALMAVFAVAVFLIYRKSRVREDEWTD
ncbi:MULTISPECIES: hypothetical protein [Sporosarcina]|uniref:Uncharacterized protein n=1 Tax=Sporosarcina contaminans TaxID=633403 RepID=A0ABW3U0S3_9BACL